MSASSSQRRHISPNAGIMAHIKILWTNNQRITSMSTGQGTKPLRVCLLCDSPALRLHAHYHEPLMGHCLCSSPRPRLLSSLERPFVVHALMQNNDGHGLSKKAPNALSRVQLQPRLHRYTSRHSSTTHAVLAMKVATGRTNNKIDRTGIVPAPKTVCTCTVADASGTSTPTNAACASHR